MTYGDMLFRSKHGCCRFPYSELLLSDPTLGNSSGLFRASKRTTLALLYNPNNTIPQRPSLPRCPKIEVFKRKRHRTQGTPSPSGETGTSGKPGELSAALQRLAADKAPCVRGRESVLRRGIVEKGQWQMPAARKRRARRDGGPPRGEPHTAGDGRGAPGAAGRRARCLAAGEALQAPGAVVRVRSPPCPPLAPGTEGRAGWRAGIRVASRGGFPLGIMLKLLNLERNRED